jgi:hypothetical protein
MSANSIVRGIDRCKAGARLAIVLAIAAATEATPASAVDDKELCVSAQQLALAYEKDVGVWIDRQTRNAGMRVICETKTVQFTRFTYAPSASMDEAWKERKAADWNAVHCNSAVWKEAIANGWKIVLSQTAADGGRTTITAQCGR